MTTELHYFGHAIAVSFEANLAYSIVIRFSNIVRVPIEAWIETQNKRAVLVMSDTETFDTDEFERSLQAVRKTFNSGIDVLNRRCICGAVCMSIAAVFLLMCVGLFPHFSVRTSWAIWACLILFAPVGAGLIGISVLYMQAIGSMRAKTKEIEAAFKWFKSQTAQKVESAEAALNARMQSEGNNN